MKRTGLLIILAIALGTSACNKEKSQGCTDPQATNYDASAEEDNGSCTYATIADAMTLDCQAFNQSETEFELIDLGLPIDYIVNCQMPISGDLKILPGVTIAFTTDAGLKVNSSGSLNAEATDNKPIVFTGVDGVSGSWAGLYIDSEDVKNKISKCTIEFAGGDSFNSNGDKGGIILYASCRAEVSNTTIKNCDSYGINSNYGGGDFILTNNTISGCTHPMFTAAEYVGSISGGTFTGNAVDAIYIDTYAGDGVVSTSQTWTDLEVPYRVKGGGAMQSHADWTIDPGVVIEFEQSVEVNITDGNSIKAVGTPSDMIVFRGVVPGQGAWKNITFNGTNVLNEIGYAQIIGGGEDPENTDGTVNLWYNAKLNIHDVEFVDNAACGVYGVILAAQTSNPNYSSSNLTSQIHRVPNFLNKDCTALRIEPK